MFYNDHELNEFYEYRLRTDSYDLYSNFTN